MQWTTRIWLAGGFVLGWAKEEGLLEAVANGSRSANEVAKELGLSPLRSSGGPSGGRHEALLVGPLASGNLFPGRTIRQPRRKA